MNGIGDEQRIQASQKRRDEMFSAGNIASGFAKANTGNAEEEHSVARQKKRVEMRKQGSD